jgi:flagellar motor switch protein FliN
MRNNASSMPLSPEQNDLLKQLAPFIELEAGMKLSTLVNRDVRIEFKGIADSIITQDKITVKRDSFFVAISAEDYGPLSLVVSNPQVFCLADLVMGGDGINDEKTKPDETNQAVYSETIVQVLKSLFDRFHEFVPGSEYKLGAHEYKPLESIKDATLTPPDGISETVAFTLKIKLAAKLDDTIHVELNTTALEYILSQFASVLESLSLEKFRARVKQDYQPNSEPVEDTSSRAKTKDDATDDSYKIDEKRNLSVLSDINMQLVVELGRSEMQFSQLLRLTKGSAIELEKQCNDPVDLYAHNQLIARGEVVAIDDCFGLKVTEVLGDLQLAKQLGLILK